MKKLELLRKKDVVLINKLTIQDVGGNFVPPFNFLHESNLDYLIEIVESEMFGSQMYPEIYHKAGVYMYNIIANHIFQDGNKRTGLESALLFLQLNGYDLKETVTNETLTNFTLSVAAGERTLEEIQKWFEENIEKK